MNHAMSMYRGGENKQFIRIKQAYEDLKIGKKYPVTVHGIRAQFVAMWQ